MMVYSILIFVQEDPKVSPAKRLQKALKEASFSTLCVQYGLDQDLIPSTLENLKVLGGYRDISPYFIVSYRHQGHRPIVVYRWEAEKELSGPKSFVEENEWERVKVQLPSYSSVFQVELIRDQLSDMGILLGYEIARWIGFYGKGLVRDLHGNWFKLNRNQAFIPVR
jgi:hypothetical protein